MNAQDKNNNTPNFVFSGIPNDETGKAAIDLLRQHLNSDRYSMRLRANGSRVAAAEKDGKPAGAYHQDLPIRHAETFRVYIQDDLSPRAMRYVHSETHRLERENEAIRDENTILKSTVETLRQRVEELERGCGRDIVGERIAHNRAARRDAEIEELTRKLGEAHITAHDHEDRLRHAIARLRAAASSACERLDDGTVNTAYAFSVGQLSAINEIWSLADFDNRFLTPVRESN